MYSDQRNSRFYVAVAVIVGILVLWFGWHTATGSAAQAASSTAIEATERVLQFNRQGERTLLTVSAIFGISVVLASVMIPYVAWLSSGPPPAQTRLHRKGSRPVTSTQDKGLRTTATPATSPPTPRARL